MGRGCGPSDYEAVGGDVPPPGDNSAGAQLETDEYTVGQLDLSIFVKKYRVLTIATVILVVFIVLSILACIGILLTGPGYVTLPPFGRTSVAMKNNLPFLF